MIFSETKRLLVWCFILLAVLILPKSIGATDYTSPSFTIKDPVIDSGFQTSTSASFGLGQSLSQLAIGQSSSASFQLWSGFQYYYKVAANTLTATAGDAEVDLLWTVPTTNLGIAVAGYEVGTGTTSGTYTFENVGNTTSFTKSGLTNGTPYFFIIKAYSAGNNFLVFSNEATATPSGITPPPGGGGGGSSSYGSVILNGLAYPNAVVMVLRDSVNVGSVTANSSGNFTVSLSGQPSGTYTYALYAIDIVGNKSPILATEQTIANSITTNVNGLVIGPTIAQSHLAIKKGGTAVISGYSAANAQVTLTLTGPTAQTLMTNASVTGFYSFNIPTANLPKGSYSAFTLGKLGAITTPPSSTLTLVVGDSDIGPPKPVDCRRSDLNCDSRVDLVDFSILLYYWEEADFSRNPRADIDKNGSIGLRDLSIMLYDWTG